MSLLETYEQQFGITTAEITSKINQIAHLTSSDERVSAVSNAERLFSEAKETLEQMELEIHSQPPSLRQKYSTRLKSYMAEHKKLEEDFRRAKTMSSNAMNRDELLGDLDSFSTDHRARLIDNTERLERAGKRAEEGLSTVINTQQVGQQILEDLASQRETLTRSRDRLKATNQDLGASSRILGGMLRRIVQNRVLLLLIMAVMLIIIGVIIYSAMRAGDTQQQGKAPVVPKSPTAVP